MDDAEWQSYSEAEQAQLTELELWIKVTPALTPNPHLALPTTTSYCCLLTIAY